ncbi:unnamed protein product [Boreogadus saida]
MQQYMNIVPYQYCILWIADRTEIRSPDGPLHQRTVPEAADGPHGQIAASQDRDKNVSERERTGMSRGSRTPDFDL